MNIEELSAWGEFVGGIAVVAGLFFVGVQLVTANREMKIAANREFSEGLMRFGTLLSTNPQLAELWSRGLIDGLESLAGSERVQFVSHATATLRMYESIYMSKLRGRLEPDIWNAAVRGLQQTVTTKGIQDVWVERKDWFVDEFQQYIDSVIRDQEPYEEIKRLYGHETDGT
jgi:hypothetical protein